jgi:hypothetical protein
MVDQVPWNELDSGIVDRVRVLNKAGWKTFASCDGHNKRPAWIRLEGTDPKPIAQTLKNAGYNQFSISIMHTYPSLLNEDNSLGEIIDTPNIFLHIAWWPPNILQNQGRVVK